MKLDPATGAAMPALGAADILAQVPDLARVAEYRGRRLLAAAGPARHAGTACGGSPRRAAAWLERPDIDGLVITHGTDTIEETAYLLDLVLTSDKPVVLVGAMRTVSDRAGTGPAICSPPRASPPRPSARGHGVLVVMDEQILPAREVRKVHTEASGIVRHARVRPDRRDRCRRGDVPPATVPRPRWHDAAAPAGLRVQRHRHARRARAGLHRHDGRFVRTRGRRRRARAGDRRLRPRQRAAGDHAGARRRRASRRHRHDVVAMRSRAA